jgi:hypothetical protein
MMKIISALLIAIGLSMVSGLAQAQATRTWVSGVGDDANPCSRTAPCKTFAGAISKTAANGEISVLDPGGFGAVTITKSISIISDGSEGGILAAGTNGIIINAAAGDKVFLKGLIIEGAGTGLNGIRFVGGGRLHVEDVVIRNFTTTGLDMASTTAGARAYLNRVTINSATGGVKIAAAAGNVAFLNDCDIDSNATFGVQVDGVANLVVLNNNRLAGSNGGSLQLLNGGQARSYGNNVISSGNAPTTTLPLQ